MTALQHVGVDLGGTKIEAVALDEAGAVRFSRRVPTPRHDAEAIVAAVASLVREAMAGAPATVGVGTPGCISPQSGRLRGSNTTCLNGLQLDRILAEVVGQPVALENDANCLTLSEATDGSAAGAAVVFGVIVGTGTGGGVVVDGEIRRGRHGIAGEWGHLPLPWAGPDDEPRADCHCGRRGCLETYLSGPGLARDHASRHGGSLSPEAIVARAAEGEGAALDTLARHRDRFVRGLAVILDVLDPDVVVVGGGVSLVPGLLDTIGPRLAAHAFTDERIETPVRRALHGDASGVRGAAWLGRLRGGAT